MSFEEPLSTPLTRDMSLGKPSQAKCFRIVLTESPRHHTCTAKRVSWRVNTI